MKVTCPGCGWSAEVSDEKIPVGGRQATCPKCKTAFIINRFELNNKPENECLTKAENSNGPSEDLIVNPGPNALNKSVSQDKSKGVAAALAIF